MAAFNNLFNIVPKKGNPKKLSGVLIAYAFVKDNDKQGYSEQDQFDVVRNGILAVTVDYRKEQSFKDFLNKELGLKFEKGTDSLIEQIKELTDDEEDLPIDKEKLEEKMGNFSSMEIIPVPARVVYFESEEQLLQSFGDIYFLGTFQSKSNAHLCATSFPIIYQANYKEQMSRLDKIEVESLLDEVQGNLDSSQGLNDELLEELNSEKISTYKYDLRAMLLNQALPKLIYSLNDEDEFSLWVGSLRKFMKPYSIPSDVDNLIGSLNELKQGNSSSNKKLELICEKIAAVHNEEFEKISEIESRLKDLG